MSDVPLEAVQIQGLKPPTVSKPRPTWVHVNHGRSHTMDLISHGSPAVEMIKQNVRKEERKRPKSMPADMRVRFGGGYSASPRNAECSRVRQVKSAGYRHDLNKVEEVTPIVLGPGYVLSRGKEKVEVTIKTSEFFSRPEKERPRSRTPEVSEKDVLIGQLKQQISDLDMYLQEERINRKLEEKKNEEDVKVYVEQIHEEHRQHIKSLEEDHQEEVEKLKSMYDSKTSEINAAAEAEIATVRNEMEFLQGAFESYKDNVSLEMDKKWETRELEVKLEHERLAGVALAKQRSELLSQKDSEMDSINAEHQRQIQLLVENHKKEMSKLVSKFSKCEADAQQLKGTLAELEQVQGDLTELHETHAETCEQLKKTTYELKDVKVKLQGYEHHFAEKVQEVDNKYALRIENLTVENTELRCHLLKKCEELFSLQALKDLEHEGSLKNAKETMQTIIRTRAKSNVSLTALRLNENKARPASSKVKKQITKRPLSAPSTPAEIGLLTDLTADVGAREVHFVASDTNMSVRARPRTSIGRVTPAQNNDASQEDHTGQSYLTLPPMAKS